MLAYYRSSFTEFLGDDPKRILGVIHERSSESGFTDLKERQSKAWRVQIEILHHVISELIREYPDASSW
jgi:hypothetical protein